jgi:hypothetical protein
MSTSQKHMSTKDKIMHKKARKEEVKPSSSTKPQQTVQDKWFLIVLLVRELEGESPKKAYEVVAEKLELGVSTVRRIANEYFDQIKNKPDTVPDLTPKLHGHAKSGAEVHAHDLKNSFIECRGHFYYGEQAEKLNMPETNVFRWMHELGIQNSKSHIKPSLTMRQKLNRILYIIHRLDDIRSVKDYCSADNTAYSDDHIFRFASFQNLSWIDEAYFYLKHLEVHTKTLPGIPSFPDDNVATTTHIPKVLFLIHIALPQLNAATGEVFDGKIGIRSLVKYVPAKRSSKHRARGTSVPQTYTMTGDDYKNFLIGEDGLFADLHAKGKLIDTKHWFVQQDGAKAHIKKKNIPFIVAYGHSDDRKIDVITQPAQSPDIIVLDLCFLYSLQRYALHIKYSVSSVEDFVLQVEKAFQDYPVDKLVRCCALQLVAYRQILMNFGGNQYRMPHTGIRNKQNANIAQNPEFGKFVDCGDYEVNAKIVRDAVHFYENETGTVFPWEKSPLWQTCSAAAEDVVAATAIDQYFDASHEGDLSGDPASDEEEEVSESGDDRDFESDDDDM